MWIVTGPFDGEESNEVGFQKSKLLKSGQSYLIGRKSTCDLVVNHKKVSHDHGQLIVGGFSPDDVANIDCTPTLRILNSKNKTMRIWREGVPDGMIIINPGATEQLRHDDRVDIVSGLPLIIQWQRICCFETPGKVRTPISIDTCASIGIHVVRTLHPEITHHLVPSYALTPAHMTSLLSAAQLVKPEWLSELLTLSTLNPRESTRALEHTFALPPESKFRPAFAAALPPTLKTFKTWEPNEARLNMLKGYRFVFVGEKGLEIPAGYRDLVKRGGAEYEAFTVSTGVVRWRKALLRAKALAEERNGKVVPVADSGGLELAVGAEEWEETVSVVKSLELELIQPENILQAVASVDTFFLDSARASDSQGQGSRETPLPDLVPNTLSEEPSIAPPIRRPHPPRRTTPLPTTSEQPPPAVASLSEPPGPEPGIAEVPIPRRLPPRRATERNRIAPSPGPAEDVGPSPSPVPPLVPTSGDAAPAATQLPTPVSQTRRLPPPRRANLGVDPSAALVSSSSNQAPQSEYSQLDKYKALFDASNPDRAPASETQPGTGASTQGVRAGTLISIPEEDQDNQTRIDALRGTKRSRGSGDMGMAASAANVVGTSADTSEGAHRVKRRVLDTNAVPQPTSDGPPQPRSIQTQEQGTGTAAGATETKHTAKAPSSKSMVSHKLDTDENFLKAVNSTKRGKKHEDNFDREFNQLRIAKPKNVDIVGTDTTTGAAAATAATTTSTGIPEAVVAPWDVIDDFGDIGIRGNFMVVVEMDIERGGSAKPGHANDAAHLDWTGRPNFKKFKTKSTAIERRQTIELVLSEENDYGIGNAYWRSAASGSQDHSDVHDIIAGPPPLPRNKSKPVSKAARSSANSRGGRARATASEDEHEVEELVEDLDADADEMELEPPPKRTSTRSKAGAKGAKGPTAKPASKTKAATAAATKKAKATATTRASPARTRKAPAGRGGTAREKKSMALFLPDEEDEDAVGVDEVMDMDEDESAAAVVVELGAGEKEGEEEEEIRSAGSFGHGERTSTVGYDERADTAGMTSTLRSTAGTQLRREAVRAAKRRAAAMGGDGDDSDDAVFKGFGGRKRGRAR